MTNMTYVQALEIAISAIEGNEAAVEKLEALKAQLVKRNERKSDKPSKKQAENLEIKNTIRETLAEAEEMTATEVAAAVGISLAKATALLTQMVKAEEVKREVEKKVAHFSI